MSYPEDDIGDRPFLNKNPYEQTQQQKAAANPYLLSYPEGSAAGFGQQPQAYHQQQQRQQQHYPPPVGTPAYGYPPPPPPPAYYQPPPPQYYAPPPQTQYYPPPSQPPPGYHHANSSPVPQPAPSNKQVQRVLSDNSHTSAAICTNCGRSELTDSYDMGCVACCWCCCLLSTGVLWLIPLCSKSCKNHKIICNHCGTVIAEKPASCC